VVEQMEPVIELVRGYIETDYDYPKTIGVLAADIKSAAAEILEGLEGEALAEMRVANDINLKMAPLTPDHHFYIDQGANAHVRQVLMAIGRKLVAAGALDTPDDVVFFRYNELRVFMGNPSAMDGRAVVAKAKAYRERSYTMRPKEWIGTVTKTQLAFPYLNLWGFPDKFYRKESTVAGQITGLGGSPGVVEGIARVVLREEQFDDVRAGDILVCQMTNPAWVVLFTKIVGLVTDAGGTVSHPAVLSREVGIPAVVGTSVPRSRSRTATGSASTGPARRRRDPRRGKAGRHLQGLTRAFHGPRAFRLAQRLSDQVKDRLLQGILDGRYPPGARIVETRSPGSSARARRPCERRCATWRPWGSWRRQPSAELASAGRRGRAPGGVHRPAELEALGARLAMTSLSEADLDSLALHLETMRRAAGTATSTPRRPPTPPPQPDHRDRGQRHPGARVAPPGAVLADLHHARRPGGRSLPDRRPPPAGPRGPPAAGSRGDRGRAPPPLRRGGCHACAPVDHQRPPVVDAGGALPLVRRPA